MTHKEYPKEFEYFWKEVGPPPAHDASKKEAGFLVFKRMKQFYSNQCVVVPPDKLKEVVAFARGLEE